MSRATVSPRPTGSARRWAVGTVAFAAAGSGWAVPAFAAPTSPTVAEALEAAVARELESARTASDPNPFAEVTGHAPRPLPSSDAAPLKPAGPTITPRLGAGAAPIRQVADHRPKVAASAAPSPTVRPAGMTAPPAPAAEPERLPGEETDGEPVPKPSSMKKVAGFFTSMFKPKTSAAPGKTPRGSLFAGFGRKERPQPEQPPIPPEQPRYFAPASVAALPAPAVPAPAPARTVAIPPAPAAPAAEPSTPSDDPFASGRRFDDWADERFAPPIAASDTFAEIRGADAPAAAPAVPDDDFHDPAPSKLAGREGAPRRLADDQPAKRIERGGDSHVELDRKLSERSGLGGFQGFCSVVLRDRRTLVDTRPEFLSVFEGRTYEFSSAEAKARFEAMPERYAPVYGGRDVVLASRGETEVEGSLTYAAWFKDRLYLFRTAESLKEFNARPAQYTPAG